MNRKFAFVSTCSKEGWVEYGENFVKAFLEYFPVETNLYMYVDFKPTVFDPRVEYRQIAVCRGLDAFQADIARLDFAQGRKVVHSTHAQGYNPQVIWNARKFSFKVFVVEHCVMHADGDVVTWIDADTIAHTPLSIEYIAGLIPPYCLLNYLGRDQKFSECGYVSYNRQHSACSQFVTDFADLYRSGAIFGLKEWHDSYVFDLLRNVFERRYGVTNFNISADCSDLDHVFINSSLGLYLDHLKGPRKSEGRSRASDLKVSHGRDYWAQMNQ